MHVIRGAIDRYTAGEDVAQVELEQVWENMTVVSGVWSSTPIYEEFLACQESGEIGDPLFWHGKKEIG